MCMGGGGAPLTMVNLGTEGWDLLVNLQDRENFSTKDKIPTPNVSVIQRFHCTYFQFMIIVLIHYYPVATCTYTYINL